MAPFAPGWHRAEGLLDLVHMDTIGPMEIQSYDGKQYCKGNLGRHSTLRLQTGKGGSKVRYKSALHTRGTYLAKGDPKRKL